MIIMKMEIFFQKQNIKMVYLMECIQSTIQMENFCKVECIKMEKNLEPGVNIIEEEEK